MSILATGTLRRDTAFDTAVPHPVWCDELVCNFAPGVFGTSHGPRVIGVIPRDWSKSNAAGTVTIRSNQHGHDLPADKPVVWVQIDQQVFESPTGSRSRPLRPGESWMLTGKQTDALRGFLATAATLIEVGARMQVRLTAVGTNRIEARDLDGRILGTAQRLRGDGDQWVVRARRDRADITATPQAAAALLLAAVAR